MGDNRLSMLVHYIVWRCNPDELGATKLNKILWYSDVAAYRATGHSISGAAKYRRLEHGPVSKGTLPTLNALQRDGKIAISKDTYFGHNKTVYLALAKPDLSAFTAEEIAIVDSVAEAICKGHTAESISLLSHDALWQEIEMGADIPVRAGAVVPGEITAEDIEWAEKALA